MSRGGTAPAFHPTAWAYIPSGNCTVRWQRRDKVAYVFPGKELETYPDEALRVKVLDTIPVAPKGWTDLDHVRLTGENWVKAKRKRCPTCGIVA
ncbi:MAG: hypothetical protein LC808_40550 [Actinobacteria bacterium]|nr:hypothetical protein [Actinomycetota bacterium]